MPCYRPLKGWQGRNGTVTLGREPPDSTALRLPCGKCTGCKTSQALAWALRCHLEWKEHDETAFTTLTYADRWLPPTLEKRHLQLFLKRYRRKAARPIRFFASGEYGEQNGRPHFHALLFGAGPADAHRVQETWGMGHTHTVPITPAAINYVAGYTAKKLGDTLRAQREEVDPETGEVYRWQPPFIQMSRRPGIGGHAREKYRSSWRSYAVHEGRQLPLPRFLHEAWKKTATPEQLEQLAQEKYEYRRTKQIVTDQMLEAGLEIAIAKQALKAGKRKI